MVPEMLHRCPLKLLAFTRTLFLFQCQTRGLRAGLLSRVSWSCSKVNGLWLCLGQYVPLPVINPTDVPHAWMLLSCIWLARKNFTLTNSFLVWEMFRCGTWETWFSNYFPCGHSKPNARNSSFLTIQRNLPSSLRSETKLNVNSQVRHTYSVKENWGNVKCFCLSWRNRVLFSDDGKRECTFQPIYCLNHG